MYQWDTCPQLVKAQVEEFCRSLREISQDNLVGIYLHGSLAMGGFNPERSDIDLIVATRQPMSVDTKCVIAELLLRTSAHPRPIEVTFVTRGALHSGEFPIPFDYHYSEMWRQQIEAHLAGGAWQQWNNKQGKDTDLAGQVAATVKRGICLYGKSIDHVFPAIPCEHVKASFLQDCEGALDEIEADPLYGILNPCRTYCYLLEGRICSKEEAGIWALQTWKSQTLCLKSKNPVQALRNIC